MSETMRALVLQSPNKFGIEPVPVPSPDRGEVLCRVERVGICGTDMHMIQGDYPGMWPAFYPFTPGHEWSGYVVALGPESGELGMSIGDRVAGTSHAPCGFCKNCVGGRYNLCSNYGNPRLHRHYGHTAQGCLADYVVHSVRSVFKIPEDLGYDDAAVADPASIALHTAHRGGVCDGSHVLVVGAGPLGVLAAKCATAMGASEVVCAARGERVEIARKLGFDAFDTQGESGLDDLRLRLSAGADIVLDAAGTPDAIKLSLHMLRRGGRCATVGIPTKSVDLNLSSLVLDEHELVGCRASTGEMSGALQLMSHGQIEVRDLITHHFRLEEFSSALDTLQNRRDGAMKILIDVGR